MPDQSSYDYAVIRVVPRVERQEFVNAGIIVWCREHDVLEARIELDEERLRAMHAAVDLDAVRRHLRSIEVVCAGGAEAGPIGQLSKRERFDEVMLSKPGALLHDNISDLGEHGESAAETGKSNFQKRKKEPAEGRSARDTF